MARAQGARARMALAFETVYGTAPASGPDAPGRAGKPALSSSRRATRCASQRVLRPSRVR